MDKRNQQSASAGYYSNYSSTLPSCKNRKYIMGHEELPEYIKALPDISLENVSLFLFPCSQRMKHDKNAFVNYNHQSSNTPTEEQKKRHQQQNSDYSNGYKRQRKSFISDHFINDHNLIDFDYFGRPRSEWLSKRDLPLGTRISFEFKIVKNAAGEESRIYAEEMDLSALPSPHDPRQRPQGFTASEAKFRLTDFDFDSNFIGSAPKSVLIKNIPVNLAFAAIQARISRMGPNPTTILQLKHPKNGRFMGVVLVKFASASEAQRLYRGLSSSSTALKWSSDGSLVNFCYDGKGELYDRESKKVAEIVENEAKDDTNNRKSLSSGVAVKPSHSSSKRPLSTTDSKAQNDASESEKIIGIVFSTIRDLTVNFFNDYFLSEPLVQFSHSYIQNLQTKNQSEEDILNLIKISTENEIATPLTTDPVAISKLPKIKKKSFSTSYKTEADMGDVKIEIQAPSIEDDLVVEESLTEQEEEEFVLPVEENKGEQFSEEVEFSCARCFIPYDNLKKIVDSWKKKNIEEKSRLRVNSRDIKKSDRTTNRINYTEVQKLNQLKNFFGKIESLVIDKRKETLVYIAPSKIHNLGLFSRNFISTGMSIIEYVGELISVPLSRAREKAYLKAGIRSTYMFQLDESYIIDATMRGNIARYVNHSCQPNAEARLTDLGKERKGIVFVALKPIQKDEEITANYKISKSEDSVEMCRCNAANCKGVFK